MRCCDVFTHMCVHAMYNWVYMYVHLVQYMYSYVHVYMYIQLTSLLKLVRKSSIVHEYTPTLIVHVAQRFFAKYSYLLD